MRTPHGDKTPLPNAELDSFNVPKLLLRRRGPAFAVPLDMAKNVLESFRAVVANAGRPIAQAPHLASLRARGVAIPPPDSAGLINLAQLQANVLEHYRTKQQSAGCFSSSRQQQKYQATEAIAIAPSTGPKPPVGASPAIGALPGTGTGALPATGAGALPATGAPGLFPQPVLHHGPSTPAPVPPPFALQSTPAPLTPSPQGPAPGALGLPPAPLSTPSAPGGLPTPPALLLPTPGAPGGGLPTPPPPPPLPTPVALGAYRLHMCRPAISPHLSLTNRP